MVRLYSLTVVVMFAFGLVRAGDAMEIGPADKFCAAVHALDPGEELVLRPGDYAGPCVIRKGGTAAQPLVIRAKDPAHRPRLVYMGEKANVLNIEAHHVTIRGLAFGPTRPNVDGVRVIWGDFVTVEDCDFEGMGGIAVVANHRNARGLTVRRNRVRNSHATAMYFGCHSGVTCMLEQVRVEQNYIQGVDAPDPLIGYGIQIKLNSWGWIRDNVIVDTKGPGIMVYGATIPGKMTVVERNAVTGSRHAAGIVVGGGPVIVRNNVVTGSVEGGIRVEDYGHRGLLRAIAIAHNTVVDNGAGGIVLRDSAAIHEVRIVNNAVQGLEGTPPFPGGRNGILSRGNIECGSGGCLRNPGERDFSPRRDSRLLRSGVPFPEDWMPRDDFTGAPRGEKPTVGAFEGEAPPIPIGFKGARR